MEGQHAGNTIDLTNEEDSSPMVLDNMGLESSDSDLDLEAYERGWRRVFGRWQGEGLPGEVTFTGLLDLIEEEEREPSQVFTPPTSALGSVSGDFRSGLDVLLERPRRGHHLRRTPIEFNEGFGPRRLFEEDVESLSN